MNQEIPWKRFSVEAIVIVLSILLALAADAAWDIFQIRRQELEVLKGLQLDYEETLGQIADNRMQSEEFVTAALEIFENVGESSSELTADQANRMLQPLFVGGSIFRPQEATLGALLSSQGLNLISNFELRGRLANWRNFVVDIERWQDRVIDLYFYEFNPYLRNRIPTKALDAIAGVSGPSKYELDARELFNDPQFESLVNDIYFYSSNRIASLNSAETEVKEILLIIEAEIN